MKSIQINLKRIFHFLLIYLISWVFVACDSQKSDDQELSTEQDSLNKVLALPVVKKTPKSEKINLNYLLGKFDPGKDTNFVRLNAPYAAGAALGRYLHKQTYTAFTEMYDSARADDVKLTILSATRNFNYQAGIWNAKWNGQRLVEGLNLRKNIPDASERALKILRYSSMPGTSRHHWGTDIDLNSFDNSYFKTGKGLKEYQWLQRNAANFGFCQTYNSIDTINGRKSGYQEEKWHWSYLPLADRYLSAYLNQVSYEDIKGFDGDSVAQKIGVIPNYVGSINQACLQ